MWQHDIQKAKFVSAKQAIWSWDFLGDGSLIIMLTHEVPWFKRFATKHILGSKWTRIQKPK
jgi:hypothetical protein